MQILERSKVKLKYVYIILMSTLTLSLNASVPGPTERYKTERDIRRDASGSLIYDRIVASHITSDDATGQHRTVSMYEYPDSSRLLSITSLCRLASAVSDHTHIPSIVNGSVTVEQINTLEKNIEEYKRSLPTTK